MKILYIALLLIPFIGNTQNNQKDANGKKHGKWVGLYENSTTPTYVGEFDHGNRKGLFKFYYKNGKIKAAMMFSKNGTFARAEMYHEDGTFIAKGNYVNQQKDSVWTYYGGTKNVRRRESWKKGKLDGKTYLYYEPQAGMTKLPVYQSITYKDSVLHGEVVEYYLNGKVKMKGNNVNGNFDGEVYYYYESGKRQTIERYKHAVRHGIWVYFNEDGTLNKKRLFEKNVEIKGKEKELKIEKITNG